MFPTTSRVHSNDIACWPRDQPPSKKQCLDNVALPELQESSLKLVSSTSSGNDHCIADPAQPNYHCPVPEGGGFGWSMKNSYTANTSFFECRYSYKKSSAYDQENTSSRGQASFEAGTAVSRWDLVPGQARESAGKYNSYGTTDHPYSSCCEGPCQHYGLFSAPARGCAARVNDKVSGSGTMSVQGGNVISLGQCASSGANNKTANFQHARSTQDFAGSSGSERVDTYSSSFTSKPDQRGSVYEAGYTNNYGCCVVGFSQASAVNPVGRNTGVYNPLRNMAGGPRCESTATDGCSGATVPRRNCSCVSGQYSAPSAVRALNSSYAYKAERTFPIGPYMSAVQEGKESNEQSIYSGNCVSSPKSTSGHAEELSTPAASKPEMTPATWQGTSTSVPAVGISPYPWFDPNFSFLSNQENNQVGWTYFNNSAYWNPNLVPFVGLNDNAWPANASTVTYPAYTSGKLACSANTNAAAAVVGSNDVTSSINMLSATVNSGPCIVGLDGGNGNCTRNMMGCAVAVVKDPTVANASVHGAVFPVPPKATGVGQVYAITADANSGTSIVNSVERTAEARTASADVGLTGQIGPQAYPSAYAGVLNSLFSNSEDSANRPKRKLKWPLPIPLFMKPHDTRLTFYDIDYTWVTHDIQVSAQGGVYAQTIDNKGCLQVFVESARTANNLLHLNHVAGVPVKISVGRNYTDNIGYIRRVPRRYSDSVLFEFMEGQGLLCAKRQVGYVKYDKGYTGDMTTGTVVLLFMPDQPLPSSVTIDKVSYQVTRRIRQPIQCFNCQRFGHESTSCTGSTRCRFCGGSHVFTECKHRGKPECVNCHEDHASTFWRCPARMAYISSDPRNDWVRDVIKDI